MSRPGWSRAIADNWRGLYGSDLFSSMSRGCRIAGSLKRRNWREYICFRGVFTSEQAARPDHRNRRTLAIGNLTGRGAETHPRNQRTRSRTSAGLVSGGRRTQRHQGGYACQRPTTSRLPSSAAASAPRRLGLSGKLLLLTIPLVMIAGMLIYVPVDRQFPDEPAERPAGRGQYRRAGAGCRAARHGAGFAGAADPQQHRRARGRHQDGAAAPAAGQRRPAADDRSRRRHARR